MFGWLTEAISSRETTTVTIASTDMMLNITSTTVLAWGMPGGAEWIVLLVIGLLIFGRRLPEVGRSLGKGIVEFKRGVKGLDDEINTASSESSKKQMDHSASESLSDRHDPATGGEKSPYENETTSGDKTD